MRLTPDLQLIFNPANDPSEDSIWVFGMRGILTLTALAAALLVMFRPGPRRVLLVLALAVPLAMVANLLRLVVTGIVAQMEGPDTAEKVFHLAGGALTFALGAAVLSSVALVGRSRA